MFFLKKVSELEDEDDILVSPDIFDSEKGLTLIDFIYNVVPTIVIKKENVSEIRVDDFDKVTHEIEEMARKMQDNDDTWREECQTVDLDGQTLTANSCSESTVEIGGYCTLL